ncbi:MAG: low temperature requirement protein A [Nocardioides sp.]|uniref:low temperature requirement protein A n=1 Tax=Nocardioides sp. TaxID=35761 RepID=UPI0039E39AE5
MTPPTADPATDGERHASWVELFFDLIAVAGVSVLATVLEGEVSFRALLVYAVLFGAFWMCWTTFMVYGNVRGEGTRVMRLMVGMFGIGVMSATVPGVADAVLSGQHDRGALAAFALTYFLVRTVGSRAFEELLVLDVPAVQGSLGAVPWLISIWVDDVHLRIALWALGLAIDAFTMLVVSGADAQEHSEARLNALGRRVPAGDERARRRWERLRPVAVRVAPEHLAERLGLFVIIVLGEGVMQAVHAAAGVTGEGGLFLAGLVSFVVLAAIFGVSVWHGYAGVPHLVPGGLPLRLAVGAHGLVSATLAAVAVSLASVIAHRTEPLADAQRWLLCGGVAVYFLIGAAAASGRSRRTVVGLVGSAVVVLAVGLAGSGLAATAQAAIVAATLLAHLAVERRRPAPGEVG